MHGCEGGELFSRKRSEQGDPLHRYTTGSRILPGSTMPPSFAPTYIHTAGREGRKAPTPHVPPPGPAAQHSRPGGPPPPTPAAPGRPAGLPRGTAPRRSCLGGAGPGEASQPSPASPRHCLPAGGASAGSALPPFSSSGRGALRAGLAAAAGRQVGTAGAAACRGAAGRAGHSLRPLRWLCCSSPRGVWGWRAVGAGPRDAPGAVEVAPVLAASSVRVGVGVGVAGPGRPLPAAPPAAAARPACC